MALHKSRSKSFAPEDIAVITCVSNPLQYERRYELFEEFERHILGHTDNLWVVEAATGSRDHQITSSQKSQHIQLRTTDANHVLWLKEAMWNIGASRVPLGTKYLLFVDADVHFVNPNFLTDTIHALQHWPVVQGFHSAVNLGPEGEALDTWKSIGWAHERSIAVAATPRDPYVDFYHPGFVYGFRTETFSSLGQWMTWPCLGSADHHSAFALLGRVWESYPETVHENWKKLCLEWQKRADTHVRGHFGSVPGTILAGWHGSHKDRRYESRWDIILRHNFDPLSDLTTDRQGLPLLTHAGMRMYKDLHNYFALRREDGQVV